ncbi:MAG: isoprenylcysteine carboxylmethyltransferase family protein [Planctomycetes bacterium]|nr:isoprenylcysteine carboxylmethyltransferase family protein [Planctomycetota bacterium]
MTRWGIGAAWFGWSSIFSAPVVVVSWCFSPQLLVTSISPWFFYVPAIILLAAGIPFWAVSAGAIGRHYNTGRLCTTGVYRLCRHPTYAAWILFIVPGALLFLRKPLLLAVPVIMYVAFRLLIHREEEWLEEKFGQPYVEYINHVNTLIPWPRT